MHRFTRVSAVALVALTVSYAAVLVAKDLGSQSPALPVSIRYVLDRAGWDAAAFSQLKDFAVRALSVEEPALSETPVTPVTLPTGVETYFAAVAGGGAPSYNEIALEKNVLYFQRSLQTKGFIPSFTNLFFANGNDGQQTVRYLDERDREQFKIPEIPHLTGAANYGNTKGWFEAIAQTDKPCPAFFYFTGHGAYNPDNQDNNWLILWEEALVSVREFASWLAPLPADQPFVTMMAQCYSVSFTNLIYENGDPNQPVALQSRCGFFATVADRPSVGCTPAVNEADYQDYSSSFFAGLTGRDRLGEPVESADYNQDGQVSYAEAHGFAKVDEETTDWPISTLEAWLQRQIRPLEIEGILAQPIDNWWVLARPEQQYVIRGLVDKLSFDSKLSYVENQTLGLIPAANTVKEAYQMRLKMELINIGAEALLRDEQNPETLEILQQLLACEAGSW